MEKFEFFEHTTDIGAKVYGENLEDLFENSAAALSSLIFNSQPKTEITEKIILKASTTEELLITWLNELIHLVFNYNFLPACYSIEIENKPRRKILKAEIKGENLDPCECKINMKVTAATYNELVVKHNKKGYTAEIIFNI